MHRQLAASQHAVQYIINPRASRRSRTVQWLCDNTHARIHAQAHSVAVLFLPTHVQPQCISLGRYEMRVMKASPSSLWPSKVTTTSAPSASSD